MAPPSRNPGSVDPDELGRREFSRSRKGWDPVEVRAHLLTMADEIKRLQSVEFELETRVASLERELADSNEFDESRVTRLLGEETARVLEAARHAGVEIRGKAEESSARLVSEAQDRAAVITGDAEELRTIAARESDEVLSAARARADELVSAARQSADEVVDKAKADATATRERAEQLSTDKVAEAEAEAERTRTASQATKADAEEYGERVRLEADEHATTVRGEADRYAEEVRGDADEAAERVRADATAAAERRAEEATAQAESEVEAAREQGRRMIAEAREARERMLRDLADRRRTARQQLEALRAGRERLLESFASAREAFDDASDELTNALPAARDAADAAARAVDDDLDVAVAELDAEIGGVDPLELGDGGVGIDPPESSGDPAGAGDDEVFEVTEVTETTRVVTVTSVSESDVPDEISGAPSTNGEPSGTHLRLVANDGRGEVADLDDDLDLDDADPDAVRSEGSEAADGESTGSVEAIFARLRAGQDTEEPGTDDQSGPGAVILDLSAEPTAGADTEADHESPGEASPESSDSPPADAAGAEEAPTLLDRRDEAIADAEKGVARRLKRAVSDQENALLDRIQRSRKAKVRDDVLEPAESAADAMWAAIVDDLGAAVEAGASFLEDDDHGVAVDTAKVIGDLRVSFDEWVAQPLSERLRRTLDESDDRSEAPERFRAAYREWKNERAPDLAGDLVTLAFNRGIVASATPTATHCWIVDHGGLPCPDAEDNHLAGEVAAGDEFPTGHRVPPAHPGCRCLLAPIDR